MLLRTLGGLALPGASFRRPKPLLLLAYLAVEGPRDRRYLSELFWMDSARPRHSLVVALSQLRKGAPGAVEEEGMRLRSRVGCDANALLEAAASQDWFEVLRLYDGPFLEGVEAGNVGVELEEWIYGTREYLGARVQEALIAGAEVHAAGGGVREAARFAERAHAMHTGGIELEANLFGRLHALLVLGGSPRARQLLREAEALGLELSDVARVATVGPPPALAALPERKTHNLPRIATSFVGREAELGELRELLAGEARLVTLVGLGGMGKTRLSLALARDQLERGAFDRVLFVPLEAVSNAQEIAGRIAFALELPVEARAEPVAAIAESIGGERALLVLDNFEQLLEGADVAVELLDACAELRVIVTSREPLGLAQEFLYPVEGLTVPESAHDALHRSSYFDALQLFLQRAKRTNPRFALREENTEAVLRICRLLDGSPLGIELAAVLVRTLAPEEVLAELEGSLDVLASRERNAPDRHASLRAVFEQTWRLLPEPQQAALQRLAVFQGGFTREAAADVTGATIPVIAALADRSLIRRRANRFGVHPLVQQYAREKLMDAPEVAAASLERHAEYFTSFVAERRMFDKALGQRTAFGEILQELENVRAAWAWAVRSRREDLLERMAYLLYRCLVSAGLLRELTLLIDAALAVVVSDSLARARLLEIKAHVLREDDPRTYALASQALDLYRRYGTEADIGEGMHALAVAASQHHAAEEAIALYEEALPRFRTLGNEHRVVSCLNNLAILTKDPDDHEHLLVEAIRHSRRIGNALDLTTQLWNLAQMVADTYGDYRRSLELLEDAIELERHEVGRKYRLSHMLGTASQCLLHLTDRTAAEARLVEAFALLEGQDHWEAEEAKAELTATHALLHYLQDDVTAARATLRHHQGAHPSLLELHVRLFLNAGELEAAAHRAYELRNVALERIEARDSLHWRAKSDLLLAEIDSHDLHGACRHLIDALQVIARFTFVPAALDAFVTAATLLPEPASQELLDLAAAHPAATCLTRWRASRRTDETLEHVRKAPLKTKSILSLATRLEGKLEQRVVGR